MAKIKVKSGDIYQISLPNELGFAYAKCIYLLEIDPNTSYPILVRIYNYRSAFPQPIQEFIDKELILCPLLIAGILPAIKSGEWKIVGNVPLEDEDLRIPHYKRGEPDENPKEWYYLVDADISKKVRSTYDKVKHLETIGATGSALVGTKIAMALLQDEGKRIEDYFELSEYFEKEYYKEVTEIPAYYKQPEFMRGKAL
jgi:Immunity protein 26